MTLQRPVSALFLIAAIYDGILAVAFLAAGDAIYARYEVPPPNHPGYVQFPAALLLVFAAMFVAIARDPAGNRNLIPYGILLKLAYCGVVGYHWATTNLPDMWKPFFIADFVFLVLFAWAWRQLAVKAPHPGGIIHQ